MSSSSAAVWNVRRPVVTESPTVLRSQFRRLTYLGLLQFHSSGWTNSALPPSVLVVWTLCLLPTFFPLRGSDVVRLGLVMSAALCPWLYAGTWKFLGRVTVRSHIISSAQTQVTVIIGASKENLIFPAFLCPSAPTLTVTVQVCRSVELLLTMT